MKHVKLWLSSIAIVALIAGASAQVWTEVGDAGELPITAQVVLGHHSHSLFEIRGSITTGADVDMYQILICDPAAFRAWTTRPTGGLEDSQLWLFDSAGNALWHNDDRPGDVAQPGQGSYHSYIGPGSAAGNYRMSNATNTGQLGAGTATWGIPDPGLYYIAISAYNRDPHDSGGGNVVFSGSPFEGIFRSNEADPLRVPAGWTGRGLVSGGYTIHLVGACYVPEPASMLALGAGLAGLLGLRRRKR